MQSTDQVMRFYFRALTPEGAVYAGQLNASSRDEALGSLRGGGYTPLSIADRPIRSSFLQQEINLFGGRRVLSPKDCEQFCRELGILLSSRLNIRRAIIVIETAAERDSKNHKFSVAIRHGLNLGLSVTESVRASGFKVPSEFLPVLDAGETTGSLTQAVNLLTKVYEDRNKFRGMFLGAMIYPAFLLVVALFTLGILAFFVAPSLVDLFESVDKPLPSVLGFLNAISHFFAGDIFVWLIPAGVLIGATTILFSHPYGKLMFHLGLYRLPLLGPTLVWSSVMKFSVTLHLYIANNSPIASALSNAIVSANFPGGEVLGKKIAEDLRRGKGLSVALRGVSFIPKSVIGLIEIGEESGGLLDVLEAITADATGRFSQGVARISSVLAPALILLVGTGIGAVIFSVFSALLEVNELAY